MIPLPDDRRPIVLKYPLAGRFQARNSPARRVPSHGTHLMGTTFAIDFVPVDLQGRSAAWSWRAVVGTEPPERFVGFGAAVVAPCTGTVVIAHDGEDDHEARRSQLMLFSYTVGQARRIRGGAGAIAGNHVVIALRGEGPFVVIAHLRRDSVRVAVGDVVEAGQVIGQVGNSGNSTQPHVHLQATDSTHWSRARGIPIAFETPRGVELPSESQIILVS
jgi:hypothetical protein